MNKPTPQPIEPAQVLELALAVVAADRFPFLATCDGNQPRVRPVSPVKTGNSVPRTSGEQNDIEGDSAAVGEKESALAAVPDRGADSAHGASGPPLTPTDLFTIYIANLRAYHKTHEIAANPRVELCYMNAGHDQVRITGLAEIVSDRPLLAEIWNDNPLLRQYLGSLDNPQLIIYRITPQRVIYMQEWAIEYIAVFDKTLTADIALPDDSSGKAPG